MIHTNWTEIYQAAQERRITHLLTLPLWLVGTLLRLYLGDAVPRSDFDVFILPSLAVVFVLIFLALLVRRIRVFYVELVLLTVFIVTFDSSIFFHMQVTDTDFAVKKVLSYSFWSIAIYSVLFWTLPRWLAERTAMGHGIFIVLFTIFLFLQLPPSQQQPELMATLVQLYLGTALFIKVFSHYTRMIESRQVVAEQLETKAHTDELTNLANRRALQMALNNQLQQAEVSADRFAVILLDIDHFKLINDTFGHTIGDTVLYQIARLLKIQTADSHSLGRWGGEEFLIILPAATQEQAAILAEGLRAAIAAVPIEPIWRITASFGVTMYRHGDTVHTLIDRADRALYRAKIDGRNRVTLANDHTDQLPQLPLTNLHYSPAV